VPMASQRISRSATRSVEHCSSVSLRPRRPADGVVSHLWNRHSNFRIPRFDALPTNCTTAATWPRPTSVKNSSSRPVVETGKSEPQKSPQRKAPVSRQRGWQSTDREISRPSKPSG
jgi:hypothetical protein